MAIPGWVWGVIALVVIIIIVIIIIVVTSSTVTSSTVLPPSSFTISWITISDLTLAHPTHVPNSVYTLNTNTSLSGYNQNIIDEFEESTIQYVYSTVSTNSTTGVTTPSTTNLFIRYIDPDGITRFALVAYFTSAIHVMKTSVDIGTIIDPTEYVGTWTVGSSDVTTTLLFT